jgi:uncharacterized protein (TIGR02996 family)
MNQPLAPTVVHAAAQLPGEAEMIASVLSNLADHSLKMVYADWLEERGDPRAKYLRAFAAAASKSNDEIPPGGAFQKVWRDVLGVTMIQRIRELGLYHREKDLLALARPVLSIDYNVGSDIGFPLGASRFGGCPDMPRGLEWPMAAPKACPPGWDPDKKLPLRLLAQFNLDDLAQTQVGRELPTHGLLSFFDHRIFAYDWVGEGAWLVTYSPDLSNLERLEPRTDFDEYNRIPPPCRLTFTESLDLPDQTDPWEEKINLPRESDPDGWDAYGELIDPLLGKAPRWHQLLGHTKPSTLGQDPIGSLDWRHLATFGTEERDLGWFWGQGDKLYYLISESNLRQRHFDEIRVDEG